MNIEGVSLRPASADDADFVFAVTEATMRGYAEATWGEWSPEAARASFRPEFTRIIQFEGTDVGCIDCREEASALVLDKLYIAPDYQNRGVGSLIIRQLLVE